jgi:hypothetical protein
MGELGYLEKMLKARPNPPTTMNASFKPMFGISLVMIGKTSSLVKDRIFVSQNDGPIIMRMVKR